MDVMHPFEGDPDPPRPIVDTDGYLRANGYTVVARPNQGQSQWRLGNRGTTVTQEDALAEIARRK